MKRKRNSFLSSWIGSCLSPLFRLVSETVGEKMKPDLATHIKRLPPAPGSDGNDVVVKHKRRKVETTITVSASESEKTTQQETDAEEASGSSLTDQQLPSTENHAPDPHSSVSDHILYHELHADEFDPLGWLFIKQLPPKPTPPFGHALPPPTHPPLPTLVLDLDETLVHCSVEPLPQPDYTFSVTLEGNCYKVYAKKRPYLEQFLQAVSQLYEVVLFTASQEVYAKKVLKRIDPKNLLKHRRFRDACTYIEGSYVKDLTILSRHLARCILIDNSPQAFGYQLDNGILIKSWEGDPKDEELLKMISILNRLATVEDVRPILREKFSYYKYVY